MNFKYACYIEISEESRKYLELLGYDLLFSARNELADLLLASQCGIAVAAITCNIPDDAINCMGNLDLFKAVSAMRDDSDSGHYIQKDSTLTHPLLTDQVIYVDKPSIEFLARWRKATLEELQKRFKET